MMIYDEYYWEPSTQEVSTTQEPTIPVTTAYQLPESHVPMEVELVVTQEALLESLSISSSSSDKSITH